MRLKGLSIYANCTAAAIFRCEPHAASADEAETILTADEWEPNRVKVRSRVFPRITICVDVSRDVPGLPRSYRERNTGEMED